MSYPAIEAKEVRFSYGKNEILHGVDFAAERGQLIAVLGPNGAGKSTLLRTINLLQPVTSGDVLINGSSIVSYKGAQLRDLRKNIGMIFQHFNLAENKTVFQNIAFVLKTAGWKKDKIAERVGELLEFVRLSDKADSYPSKLSGGQKQRVAIAGIIAMCPECIVLDEPTAMLDPQGRREVIETVKKLNRENGVTIVLITHYMDEAAKADRIVVMDEGKIILEGVPKDIFSHTEEMKSIGLDVPQVTDLMYELRKSGVSPDIADTHIITEDECVTALTKLLGKA